MNLNFIIVTIINFAFMRKLHQHSLLTFLVCSMLVILMLIEMAKFLKFWKTTMLKFLLINLNVILSLKIVNVKETKYCISVSFYLFLYLYHDMT